MGDKKSKPLLKQSELFNIMIDEGLSPNQYYILCSMKDSLQPIKVNLHLELRYLKVNGWIKQTEDNYYKLEPKALIVIRKVESLFSVQKKKTSNQLMGKDYKTKLKAYNEIFPTGKLPHGKAARSAISNLETAFRWFFENHEFSWDLIIEATKLYVDEYEANNYKYMRTSQYFIRKQASDKTWGSELADYCLMVESGGDTGSIPTFKQKVV